MADTFHRRPNSTLNELLLYLGALLQSTFNGDPDGVINFVDFGPIRMHATRVPVRTLDERTVDFLENRISVEIGTFSATLFGSNFIDRFQIVESTPIVTFSL